MIDTRYRILVVGPTGAGKSQLCNFVQNDLTNSKNTVSDSLESCTQDPKSNEFKRIETNFDFIDTAGNSDSEDNDIVNLKKLVDYLKELKQIHYIILVLKFGERFTGDTKEYIETLGKIFTTSEFFSHLCIVFTKFPNEPNEQDLKTKDKFNLEINKLLRKKFELKDNEVLPDNDIYFIDTRLDEKKNDLNERNQKTIDVMLKQIRFNQKLFTPINTENLDITGKSAKLRREKEIEMLKKQYEEEKRKKALAEKQAKEAKKKEEKLQKEMERKRKEMEKANEQERIKRENEYKELMRKIEQKRKKDEEDKKKMEEEKKRYLEEQEKMRKEKLEIEEEKKRNKIISDKLNTLKNVSDFGSGFAKVGGIGVLGSIGLGLLGAAMTPFCPILGPCLVAGAFGGGLGGASEVVIGGAMYGIAEYQKQNL